MADSFEDVYRAHWEDVYRFCLLHTGRPELAEDLAEDALLAAYKAYDSARPPADRVKVWLFRIARNIVIDNWRRERRRNALLQLVGRAQAASPDVETIALRNEELARVMEIMARMPARERLFLGLRFSGLTGREVAELLGIPQNTANSAMGRAFQKFRELDEETP